MELSNQPSTEVCAFINAFIESIDFLRVLLALARQPDRAWAQGEIASATAIAAEKVNSQLQRLVVGGFVATVDDSAQQFQYRPRATEFEEMVGELIKLDDQRPVTLIRLVYARQSGSAQAFADAFRLRRS